jgi:hypothetical protein
LGNSAESLAARQAGVIKGHTRRKLNQIAQLLHDDILVWALRYFPHHMRMKCARYHKVILDAVVRNRWLAIAAPRESSKSTLVAFLYVFHCISFQKKRFIVICSKTYGQAVRSLENIKKEMRDNEKYSKDFKITLSKESEGDSIFHHPDGYETRVLCKGAEQLGSIRGEKFGAYRPDLIVVDDLEEDELVRNPERRTKLKEDFDTALVPAGDTELVQLVAIGTVLHDDSLMAKLINPEMYREYKKYKFVALFKKGDGLWESLWDEKWTVAQLLKLEQEKPDVFAKEYQNDPVSGMMSKFKKEDFRYWKIENLRYVLFGEEGEVISSGDLRDCRAGIGVDLAWEEKREADFSVIMPVFLTPNCDLLVDTYYCNKGLRPDEFCEILFTMEERLRALTSSTVPIGFEKAKLEKVMKHLLGREMRVRNKWLLTKDVAWDGDKITRIVTKLQPRYAQHSIYHRRGMGDLESQLLRIPSGAHDDAPDALQIAVSILEYPKQGKKPVVQDNEFEWWRKKAIEYKNRKTNSRGTVPYHWGGKSELSKQIPCKVAYR